MQKYVLKNLKKSTLSFDIVLNNKQLEGCHIGARHSKNNKSRIITENELKNTPEIGNLVRDGLLRIIPVAPQVEKKHPTPESGKARTARKTKSVPIKPKDEALKE